MTDLEKLTYDRMKGLLISIREYFDEVQHCGHDDDVVDALLEEMEPLIGPAPKK